MLSLKIDKILKEKNKSKYWFSQQTGIAPNNINKIYRNETSSIAFDTLEKICKALDCSINDLFESNDPQMHKLLTNNQSDT